MLSGNWRPFCLNLNVLSATQNIPIAHIILSLLEAPELKTLKHGICIAILSIANLMTTDALAMPGVKTSTAIRLTNIMSLQT